MFNDHDEEIEDDDKIKSYSLWCKYAIHVIFEEKKCQCQ